MRVILTADLHYNHPRSRPLADELIDQINRSGGDVLVFVGDTAVADGEVLEQCLGRVKFAGEKLFIAGNHELWTNRSDSESIFREELPRRVRELGWRWLQTDPLTVGEVGFVGSVGWYDYAFADASLGIPEPFYRAKVSPRAAEMLGGYEPLLAQAGELSESARSTVARWNDGKFIKLKQDDRAFVDELCDQLERQLESMKSLHTIVAAVHHLPFAELLPPVHPKALGFARAFLGSPRVGEVLCRFENVRHAYCGHSHFYAAARVGQIDAINIGSGYRSKRLETLDLQPF